MKTLEIKHLAPYLPYELKCNVIGPDDKAHKGVELTSISTKASYEALTFVSGDTNLIGDLSMIHIEMVWPLLRPLSDLTEEIEVNGERFVPDQVWFKETNWLDYHYELQNMAANNYCDGYLPYKIQEKLIEWHFDVFGLLEHGLAIDLNTIKE